ncbi:MAG: metallophosphoesterase family protein [Myxococcales bacterium]|nr:metallophosphoesterase family protein [Myxococcales bacterium]
MTELGELRRVGVLGDVHAEDVAVETAIADLHARGVDAVLCVGDIADGKGDLERTVALLKEHRVVSVLGNHERWFLDGTMRGVPDAHLHASEEVKDYFRGLPRTVRFQSPLGGVLLCHGVGDDDMAELRSDTRGYALQSVNGLRELWLDPEISFMIAGHTHERMVRAFPGLVVINAGTVRREAPGFIRIDFDARTVEQMDLVDGRVVEAETLPLPDPLPLQ